MKENALSKAAKLSDARHLDGTDILPLLEEISEEELCEINGGTGRLIVEGALTLYGLPAPKHRPHDPTK